MLVGPVDLVEKQKTRNAEIFQFTEDITKLRQLVLLASIPRRHDRRDRGAHIMRAALPAVDAAVVVCEADEKKLPQLQIILRELTISAFRVFCF